MTDTAATKPHMLIVLSPAKKLELQPPEPDMPCTTPRLQDQAAMLVQQLRHMGSTGLARLMKLSDRLAELNAARYRDWQDDPGPEVAKPALFMFRGDVYQGLDADSLDAEALAFAQQHLRILSGLYGVLRPLDRIQPYRLEMGTRLATARGRNLYEFWGTRITELLMADSAPPRILINLASNEYFKAIQPAHFDGRILNIAFKEAKADGYRTIGLFAKRARGLMARYILDRQLTDIEGIRAFDRDGYRFNDALSSDTEWVFTRGD